jgi:tetratricopeptide (TPR) repeat protein
MLRARGLLLGAALLLGACQQATVPESSITSGVSPAVALRSEGDALMAKADYRQAVEKYRQAVDLEPGSVPLRFALGTAYSFLDKRPEAIAQFRWLLGNAAADSVEHQAARRWLVRVGALVEPGGAASQAEREASATKGEPIRAGRGAITGKTEWSGLDPTREPVRMNIALTGDEDATRAVNRKASITLGDPYEFKDVPEGQYRVLGILGEQTIIWDQKVTVQTGKALDLALTQATSQSPKFVFPQEEKPKP